MAAMKGLTMLRTPCALTALFLLTLGTALNAEPVTYELDSIRGGELRVTLFADDGVSMASDLAAPTIVDTIAEPAPTLALMRACGAAALQGGTGKKREQRLVASEGVFVVLDPGLDHALDAPCGSGEHTRHLVRVGWRQGQEAETPSLSFYVDAVQRQGVEVEVQVECRAETLDEGGGATLLRASTPLSSRTSAQLGEQRTKEGAEHSTRESCVVGAAVAERIGEREHPLPDRDRGQHAIDEVSGGVRHAASATGGTKSAPLAREGD